jgi:hypothetical protein
MFNDRRVIAVVPADQRDAVRNALVARFGAKWATAFRRGLSVNGQGEATHYIANAQITTAMRNAGLDILGPNNEFGVSAVRGFAVGHDENDNQVITVLPGGEIPAGAALSRARWTTRAFLDTLGLNFIAFQR